MHEIFFPQLTANIPQRSLALVENVPELTKELTWELIIHPISPQLRYVHPESSLEMNALCSFQVAILDAHTYLTVI